MLIEEISRVKEVNMEICWLRGRTSDMVWPLPVETSGSVMACWSSGSGNVLNGGGRAATVSILRSEYVAR